MRAALSEVLEGAREGPVWVRYPHLSAPHGFSTRLGGVSEGPYRSLNVGLSSGDDPERVRRNQQLLSQALGLPVHRLLSMEHGRRVVVVEEPGEPPRGWPGDACITARPGVSLMITTADCVPIFFHDPVRRVVGLAHAGWRGTLAGVGEATVAAMQERFGSRPGDLEVAIGPAIGPCCFEVDEDVASKFRGGLDGEDLLTPVQNKWTVDLWQANRKRLVRAGVDEDKIRVSRLCTACQPDLFFSYRRDRRVTGRMAAVIALP